MQSSGEWTTVAGEVGQPAAASQQPAWAQALDSYQNGPQTQLKHLLIHHHESSGLLPRLRPRSRPPWQRAVDPGEFEASTRVLDIRFSLSLGP